jgi:prepilin-type processing-associated H-X9-DG protein
MAVVLLTGCEQGGRIPAERMSCQNQLKQIMLGLLNYEDKRKSIPPAITLDTGGKSMHSWRVYILTEIEEGPLFQQYRFDEPWNSPHNSKVTSQRPEMYHSEHDKQAGPLDTSFVAVLSPRSVWKIGSKSSLAAAIDGLDKTVLLIEMKNSGIHWAEPRDLDLADLPATIDKNKLIETLSFHTTGLCVAFADGHVAQVPIHSSLEYLEALVSRNGGEKIEWENDMPRVVPKAPPHAVKGSKETARPATQ